MATLGALEPFNPATVEWETYKYVLTSFLDANGIAAPEDGASDRRKAVLLAYIGSKTVQLLRSLTVPEEPRTKTYDQLLELLDNHYRPQQTQYAARHVFHARKQRQGEKIADYVADLRQLVAKCDYAHEYIDTVLIEQLTEGLFADYHRKKLIERLDFLKADQRRFANAFEFAQRLEAIDIDVRKTTALETIPAGSVNATRSSPLHGGGSRPVQPIDHGSFCSTAASTQSDADAPVRRLRVACFRCGLTNHLANECRSINLTCSACRQKGHLARVCQTVPPTTASDSRAVPAPSAQVSQPKAATTPKNSVQYVEPQESFDYVSSIYDSRLTSEQDYEIESLNGYDSCYYTTSRPTQLLDVHASLVDSTVVAAPATVAPPTRSNDAQPSKYASRQSRSRLVATSASQARERTRSMSRTVQQRLTRMRFIHQHTDSRRQASNGAAAYAAYQRVS